MDSSPERTGGHQSSAAAAAKMLVSPMAERNKESILEVLADYVDETSSAFGLELGSGTGQHIVHFARALPSVTWQPSEISPASQQRYLGGGVLVLPAGVDYSLPCYHKIKLYQIYIHFLYYPVLSQGSVAGSHLRGVAPLGLSLNS